MIRAGEKLGDLKKVLPACREVLRVAPDTVRTTMHYMVAILLLFAPVAILLIIVAVAVCHSQVQGRGWRHGGSVVADCPVRLSTECRGVLVDFEALVFLALLRLAACLHRRAGLDPLVPISPRAGGGLDQLGGCRGSRRNCCAPFPPCSPCCWMAGCRRRKPCAWRAKPPPMRFAAAARSG